METVTQQSFVAKDSSLIVVDEGVANYQDLLANNSQHETILLDSSKDGIAQITDVLATKQNISSISIFSHGDSGVLKLGNAEIDAYTLSQYTDELSSWTKALTEDADLLFWGCNVVANQNGQDLMGQISSITGADVAASDDITGISGDYDLEYSIGSVKSHNLSINQSWEGNLGWIDDIVDSVGDFFQDGIDQIVNTVDSLFDEVGKIFENPFGYTKEVVFEYIKNVYSEGKKLIGETRELIERIQDIDDIGDIVDIIDQTVDVLVQTYKLYEEVFDFTPDNEPENGTSVNPRDIAASTHQLETVSNEIQQLLPSVESRLNQIRDNHDPDTVARIEQRISDINSLSDTLSSAARDLRDNINNPGEVEVPVVVPSPPSSNPNIRADNLRINRLNRTLDFSYSTEALEDFKGKRIRYNVSFLDDSGRKIHNLKDGKFIIKKSGKGMVQIPIDDYLTMENIPHGAKQIRLKLDRGDRIKEANELDNVYIFKNIHKLITNDESAQYIASNSDLLLAFGSNLKSAKKHYVEFGYREQRALDSFNEAQYLASHPDLIDAFGNGQYSYEISLELATRHYIDFGYKEQRALDSFNGAQYLAAHPDLMNAFGNGQYSDETALALATRHYIEFGHRENRIRKTPQFLLHTGTPLHEVGNNFDFIGGDYNRDGIQDLYVIGRSHTGTNSTEVHVLNGADNFQSFLTQTGTALPTVDASYEFMVGDYNRDGIQDLYAIKRFNTGTNSTEVHVLNGANNFQSFLLHTGTALHEADASYEFMVGDYNRDGIQDLYAIKRFDTGTNSTEVHVLNGANNFQSFLLHTGTALHEVDDTFEFMLGDFNRDGVQDLYAVKRSGTGTNSTEVHVLNGANNYQPYLWNTGTVLHEVGNEFDFVLGDYDRDGLPDLYAIKRFDTGTNSTEIHVLNI